MENWRFLIQQEGDREWLPLELPESEILEGRYRLVGQSQPQQPVQVQLVYRDLDTAAVPRHYRRTAQTNAQGLVGIFPFTRLQPGLWEIRCHLEGEAVVLHLQVVPQDGGSELEPELDLSLFSLAHASPNRPAADPGKRPTAVNAQSTAEPPISPDPKTPDEAMASVAELFQTVEAMADQVISAMAERMSEDRALEEAAALLSSPPQMPKAQMPEAQISESPASEALESQTQAPTVQTPAPQTPASQTPKSQTPESQTPEPQTPEPQTLEPQTLEPATIQLDACAYTLYRGHPLTLKGTVLGTDEISGLPAFLTLTLIEPQTGEAIATHTRTEAIARLPQSFDWDIAVSLPPQTQLVLARLSLRTGASVQLWPVAECSFAVMVLSERAEPGPAPALVSSTPPIELPSFLQGSATVPPEAKAAALAKIAELGVRQAAPALEQSEASADEPPNEVPNPFEYPDV